MVGVLVDLFETTNPAVRPGGDQMTVREFLTGAEGRALVQLRGTPAVRAKLKEVFGLIHHERGELALAREALEEALGEQRRLGGPDRPDALSLCALRASCVRRKRRATGPPSSGSPSTVIVMSMATSTRRRRERFALLLSPR